MEMVCFLFWNPSREAFTIPFFDMPIMKYGVLFAIGFALAYFFLIYVTYQQILRNAVIKKVQITNWPRLYEILESYSKVQPFISKSFKEKLQSQKAITTISAETELATLKELNHLIQNDQFCSSPQDGFKKICSIFPDAILNAKEQATFLIDRLLWYAVLGGVIGARLGEVLFYDPIYYLNHPLEIFMLRQGGLASHGAAVALMLVFVLFYRKMREWVPGGTFWNLLDLIVIPVPITGACIRIGNFFNQEIIGTETNVPWAIIFGNPVDYHLVVPRHPVQLYEGFSYIVLSLFLFWMWKYKDAATSPGLLSGTFFLILFSSRFFLEFFKVAQSNFELIPYLDMGQILSIPFIILGLWLVVTSNYKNKTTTTGKVFV